MHVQKYTQHMKNNKSSGPDGFSVEFYKLLFLDIGVFLVRSVNYGFENEELSVTQMQGVITCVPKDKKPKQFIKNWRPIYMLNTAYKIASACISNRLKNSVAKNYSSRSESFYGRKVYCEKILEYYMMF